MVEGVGHLHVEPSADTLGDPGGLGYAEVNVPTVQSTVETAAGTPVNGQIRRPEELGVVIVNRRGVAESGQRPSGWIAVYGRCHDLVVKRDISAAIPEHDTLSGLLAATKVDGIQWNTSRENPDSGDIPTAYDFVDHAAARGKGLPNSERQIICGQGCKGVAAVKLSRAIIAVQIEGVECFVEALLVLADLVERVRERVVEVKGQTGRGRFAQAHEPCVVIGATMTADNIGIENLVAVKAGAILFPEVGEVEGLEAGQIVRERVRIRFWVADDHLGT